MLSCWLGIAQVNQTYNFNTNAQGWTGDFSYTTTLPCDVGSIRVNLYSFNNNLSQISPPLSISNGSPITMTFDTKAINWSGSGAASPNAYNLNVQWSSAANGPWTTISTVTNTVSSATCANNSVTFTPATAVFYVRFNSTIVGSNDIYLYLDNIVLNQAVGACDPVNNLALTSNTPNSAGFTWNQNGSTVTNYEYEVRTTGLPGSGATGLVDSGTSNTTTATTNLLTPNTAYVFYVRKNCGSSTFSEWNLINFRTPCVAFDVPFFEGFNSDSTTENCWTVINANGDTDAWNMSSTTAQEGNQAAVLYTDGNGGSNDDWLISPAINMTGQMRLRFYYRVQSEWEPNDFEILFSTTGNQPANFTNVVMPLASFNNTTYQEMLLYFDNVGTNVGYIAFRVPPGGLDGWNLYIDNVRIDQAPTCIEVESITVGEVSKNTAAFSWTPTLSSATATYTWEVRTSGLPGSGATGLAQTGTTAAGVTADVAENLDPSTEYFFYVRANCSATDSSAWDEQQIKFTTMCNYPDLLSTTPDEICGIGSGNLSATSTGGILMWSDTPNGVPLFTGADFQTPIVNTSTTFYVKTGIITPNTVVQVGSGISGFTGAGETPYYHGWGGQKAQYIFRAEELLAAGLAAGPINSMSFDVVTAGSTLNDFSLAIGTTTQSTGTLTYVTGLTQVVAPFSHVINVGLNNFAFNTPFVWDGISNIVIQTSYSNNNYGGSTSSTRSSNVGFVSTSYRYSDNVTSAVMLANTTASYTSSVRPNVHINGVGLCSSPSTPVLLTVTPPAELVLSAETLETCQGNFTDVLTITAGAQNYDTYQWSPSIGVSGNAQSGWTFNPQETTTYTLVASQSEGVCSIDIPVTIEVTSLGYEILDETYVTCEGDVLELSITAEEIDINTLPSVDLLSLGFNTSTDLGVTLNGNNTTMTHLTNFYSEGNGSIKLFPNTSANANIEINQTVDLSNSYGLLLEFDQVALLENQYWAYDYGYIQYSTNNGNTWTTFTKNQYLGQASIQSFVTTNDMRFARDSYSDWAGTMNNSKWKSEKFFLPYELSMNNLKLRFVIVSDGIVTDDSWYIDNIKIKKVSLPEIEWSPATHLFVDQQMTQPYAGESIGTVYFSNTQSGNYPYTVNISNDLVGCETTISTKVIIPELIFQGLTNPYYCTATSVEDLEFDAQPGVEYVWYATLNSQTPITTIPSTGIYYVRIVTDQCSSSKQPVQITIIGNANITVSNSQSFCDGATVSDLVAIPSNSAGTVQWFASANDTQPLDGSVTLVNGTTYYANQILHGCESIKIPVTVQIYATPSPLTTSELIVCANSTVGSIVIENTNALHWYVSATSTTPIPSQTILTSGTYYIAKYVAVCDSPRVAVNVEVVANLTQPQVNVIDICGSGIVGDLNAFVSGTNGAAELRWFVSATATTPLPASQNLTTGTYYVEQYLTGCSSPRKAVAVRVTSKVAPVINAQQVCQGTLISEISIPSVSGTTYNWHLTPSSTTALAANTVLTTGTYYVRRVQYGCISEPTAVSVNVLPIPSSPTGVTAQVFPQGSVLTDLEMDQAGIVWYISYEDALSGNNPLQPNIPLVDGQTYYGVVMNASGCASLPTAVTVEIFLGINDLDIANLKVYPNPTKDIVNISYKESIDKVEVYSMLGQRVLESQSSDTNVSLDLSQLSSGTYMLKIVVGESSQLVKVIKK